MDNFMAGLEAVVRIAVFMALLVLFPLWGPFWLLGLWLNRGTPNAD